MPSTRWVVGDAWPSSGWLCGAACGVSSVCEQLQEGRQLMTCTGHSSAAPKHQTHIVPPWGRSPCGLPNSVQWPVC